MVRLIILENKQSLWVLFAEVLLFYTFDGNDEIKRIFYQAPFRF